MIPGFLILLSAHLRPWLWIAVILGLVLVFLLFCGGVMLLVYLITLSDARDAESEGA